MSALLATVIVALGALASAVALTIVASMFSLASSFPLQFRHLLPLAYAGGSLGVLIGADILNLGKIQGLGTPVASIGGAGTIDGIFVTGIMAVLLARLVGERTSRRSHSPRYR